MDGMVEDINERKRAEETLRESDERFTKAFRSIPDALIISRLEDGKIIEVNDSWYKVFGYSRDEVIGKSSLILNLFADPADRQSAIALLHEQGFVRDFELQIRHKSGALRTAILSIELLEILGEQYMLTIVQDITERKKAEEALKESEEHFRSLYENSSIGIYRTTPDGKILLANPKLIELLEYSTFEELSARDLTKYGYEPSYTRSQFLEMVEKEGEIRELESCWITKEGNKIYIREGARAIRDSRGKTLYYDGIVEDISERKRAENNEKLAHEVLEHLNKNEDSAAMITEIIQSIKKSTDFDAIGIRIKEGEDFLYYGTVGFNESFIQTEHYLCSYDREGKLILDNEGKPLLECMCGNILSGKIDFTKSYFTEGGSFNSNSTAQMLTSISDLGPLVKHRNQCAEAGYESLALIPIRSGKEIVGLLQLNDHRKNMFTAEMMPFFEGLGSSIGLALKRNQVLKEILKLNEELEQRVTQRTVQFEAANKELEAFSYSVSHDLRAPLRAIAGFSKILVEDFSSSLDAEAQRLLNVITNSAKNMGELIDDLLAFSRLSRLEIKMSRIDMKGMAKSIYYELAPVPERDKINFSVLSIPDAYGDPSMIRQVWRNLISNAIKFSSTKDKPVIEIGRSKSNTENIYYVKDNGVGFNMNYAQKLFVVFQRLHSSKDFEGTGVGLANVQRIINRHGGRVWAEGKVDEGAVFYFSLNK